MFRKPSVDDCNTRAPSPSSAVLAELNNIAVPLPPPKRLHTEDNAAAAASPISELQHTVPPPAVETAQEHTEMPSSDTTAELLSEESVPVQCQSGPAEVTTPLSTPAAATTSSTGPCRPLRAGLSGMLQCMWHSACLHHNASLLSCWYISCNFLPCNALQSVAMQ